jgi:hypothetical protein
MASTSVVGAEGLIFSAALRAASEDVGRVVPLLTGHNFLTALRVLLVFLSLPFGASAGLLKLQLIISCVSVPSCMVSTRWCLDISLCI